MFVCLFTNVWFSFSNISFWLGKVCGFDVMLSKNTGPFSGFHRILKWLVQYIVTLFAKCGTKNSKTGRQWLVSALCSGIYMEAF